MGFTVGFRVELRPGGQVIDAGASETLLDAVLRNGIAVPHGCREGACGSCRARILSGRVDHGAAAHALAIAERTAGWALLCQASALSDVVVEVPQKETRVPAPRTLPVRVERLTRASPDVMLVELRLPAGVVFDYLPGQYVEFILRGGCRRAFSLAAPAGAGGILHLHIRRAPGGVFTGHVFEELKAGDILRIEGPFGAFYLRESSPRPMLLVAGGTGFAPVKAIVEQAMAKGLGRPMALYWGGRTRADLYLNGLAEHWAQGDAGLRYVPVLSDPDAGGDAVAEPWVGRTGWVHRAAMADLPDMSAWQAYVCGPPAMVRAARADFVERCGLPENEFFADAFVHTGEPPIVEEPPSRAG